MTVETARPAIAAGLVRQHLDRLGELLAAAKADGLLVYSGTNILAFCGVPLGPSDRLVCGLVDRDGRVAFVVPSFETQMAGGLPAGSELVPWEEREDPYEAVATAARTLGLDAGVVLLDGHTWLEASERLAGALPRASLRPDPGVIESVRMIKSREEVEAIRAACHGTGRIYALVGQHLRAGISERRLSKRVMDQHAQIGASPWSPLIQGGETASIPHQPTGERVIREGDAVIVDFVCGKDGYLGDMTRTFAVGRPDEELKRAYAVVRAAQRAAIEAVRPGVTCESVDRAARSVIERAGLGEHFSHRTGHGIGLDVHEPPYLVGGNRQRLEPGMCFTVEPGVYLPDRFGVRIEDVVAVTTDGCEVLSSGVPTDVSSAFR